MDGDVRVKPGFRHHGTSLHEAEDSKSVHYSASELIEF
jgi:hypothetical protein